MPNTLTLNQIAEKNKQHASSRWVVLFVLRPPASLTTVDAIYMAQSNTTVTYDGTDYTPFNLSLGTLTETSEGDFPSMGITINNPVHILDSFIEDTDGLDQCTLEMFTINTGYLSAPPPVTYTWDVDSMEQDDEYISFTLMMPSALRRQIPDESFRSRTCQFSYSTSYPCHVTYFDIEAVTLTGTDPVLITLTDHTFETDDDIIISSVTDIADLNGSYEATKVGADTFSLQSTDSSDFSGVYSSGGKVGFLYCDGTVPECIARNNINRGKFFPGLRSRTARYL